MENTGIDYDALKRRGFLKQKQERFFALRTRMDRGVYHVRQIKKLAEIAERYGRGFMHATVRQGVEIPFIKYADIEAVERELRSEGIPSGASGPRLRTTVCCPGNNWCKSGLVDTFALYERIENELGIRCANDLPHKFKIAISGCPNACTRAQATEIGIHGQVDPLTKASGYAVYLGGCGGKNPRPGFRLEKVYSAGEALELIGRVVSFFRQNAQPGQRLALLIEQMGREEFLRRLSL